MDLLEEGVLDRAITCVETFDYDVVDKIYDPYDNLGLSVILHGDGTREYKVLGSLCRGCKGTVSRSKTVEPVKEIFTSKSLAVSFLYNYRKRICTSESRRNAGSRSWRDDIKNGPEQATGAMAVLVAMLLERYKAGKYPLALVSMDNCSKNGAKLRESVTDDGRRMEEGWVCR
ncbi:MAG: hypothetical protein ACLR0R_09250 [[Ruminococcus] lactaris]|uniref:hypothetical protein n=1 Tax=[Ruminococcus] lactaris TaxID=46228 RepID=UPI0039A243DB